MYSAWQNRSKWGRCTAPWSSRSSRLALNWGGPRTLYIIYTKQQDKTTSGWVGNYTCEHSTAASGDSLGPNMQQAFISQTCTKGFGKNMAAEDVTSSISDVNAKHVFSYVSMYLSIFFQCSVVETRCLLGTFAWLSWPCRPTRSLALQQSGKY